MRHDRVRIRLAGRREHRSDGNVVGATLFRFQSLHQIVGRVPDDLPGTNNPSGMFHRQVLLTDMHAIGAAEPGNIRTVVHDCSQAMAPRKFDQPLSTGKTFEFTSL
jgi:hypothetical protein